ncbi:MAG: hypothetical protein IJD14_02230 [Christensenellaceae bacterium]|nr:hypothetical protein [Christensenellaceae bacterium]
MKLYDLYDIPADVISMVGGKAARLCGLYKQGFNVPQGFVIYDAKTEDDFDKAAKYWQESGLGNCAVRSSAYGEDGSAASSAGQYETVLNVNTPEDFKKAVKTCLDSLNSVTVTAYEKSFGSKDEKRMTVVVQKMITPYAAGVCFSKDPSGRNCTLIEAVRGLGEALVSGAAQADEYRVSGHDIARTGEILNDEQILKIAAGSRLAAEKFGFTADTEWAIDGKGELFWLQLRPVTTEDMPTIDEFDGAQDLNGHVVTTCNISEMMPGAVTPLTHSTSVRALDWGVRKLMVHSKAYPSMDAIAPYSCYFSIGNHLFGDLTPLYMMDRTMVLASKASIDMSICGVELKEAKVPDVPKKVLPARIRNFALYITSIMNKKKACREAERIAEGLSFDTDMSALKLWMQIDEKMHFLNEVMYYHYLTSAFSGMMSSALNLQLEPYFENNEDQHAAVAACLENIPNIESADILMSMYKISDAVKKENDFCEYTADIMRECIKNGSDEVKNAYNEFMKKHGHRSICECEMRNLSLCDDEKTFLGQLTVVANSGDRTQADPNGWLKNQEVLLERIPKNKRKTFEFMIKFSRTGAQIREYTKSRIVKTTYKFKKAYGSLANKLVESGMLPDADCVYFLTHEELGRLVSSQDEHLVKKALARRRLYPEQQKLRFPEITYGRPEAIVSHEINESITSWNGTPVSRGIVEGPARIVHDINDANELKLGEIMIAGFTDAGWTPYYSMLGGLVTEVGAALSHGAVVAREYSLPLVTNVRDITLAIHTGDIVRVDGAAGTVELIKKAG